MFLALKMEERAPSQRIWAALLEAGKGKGIDLLLALPERVQSC